MTAETQGNSLAVQWLGLGALTALGMRSIPGQGTNIPPPKKRKSRNSNTVTTSIKLIVENKYL